MAYATKYLFKWQSANGTTREIRVLKDGYSGTVIQRHLGRAPVLKKQHNGNVYGTSLEFFAECAVDGEFAEFYTSDPKAYRTDLYAGSTLLWQGYITPELYSEPDIAPPYDVQVIATDGIGELKLYDFEPRGIVTLRALLTYLLGYTGLGTDVYLISSIKPGGTGAAGSLLSKTINVDYKAGDTCYEVLSYLLDTLHATITWWKGAWILARETNVTFQNGKVKYYNTSGNSAQLTGSVVTLGRLRVNDAWPVGQLSTVIDPAKKSVTVQAPWHPVTAFTNSGMTSDTGWTKSNNAAYSSAKSAYSLPDNGATVNLATVSQSISMVGLRMPIAFSGKFCATTAPGSGQIYGGVAGVVVEYATGGTTYHLGKDEEGNAVWVSGAAGSTNYDFQVRLQAVDTDEINAESLEFDIPAFALGSTYPSGTLTFRIVGRAAYVFSAYLDVILPRGYQDRLHLDNGARGEGGDVEIAIGRETSDISYYQAFLQGILLDSGALITSFKDDYITDSGLDYLSFIARDYARSLALPRLKRTGTVFLESAVAFPPLVFTKGSVDYWLEGFSWDMYEDELEISARSLPTATITVDSEVISEASGTVSSSGSYGASSSIGGGGGVNYFQINGTLSSLVELKDQYTYLGPKGGLFFSGATLSGTPTPDLYVDTVNNQRVLRSPLPLITGGDQIVIDGTPGGGGGTGGAGYLYELGDVYSVNNAVVRADDSAKADGDLFSYNSAKGKWVAYPKASLLSGYYTSTQTDSAISSAISALNLGAASTYGIGSVASGNNGLVTGGAVWTAIDNLPEPMVFKGSLGTGGTITALPVNGTASIGDTYKVITAGTYAGQTAKIGDTFICDSKTSSANTWTLIPSGDEPSGTVTSVGLTVPTGLSVSGSPITTSGTLAVSFASGYSIPTTAKQSNWDTAYGWGNHASAGYLTSAVTSLGAKTGAITLSGGLSINSSNVLSSTTYKLKLNNTTNGDSTNGVDLGTLYAPTGGGTANQVLISAGSTSTPSWTNQSNLSVGTASKLGSSTVGGTAKPIYLNAGTATALSATVGSNDRPVYLNSGTITQVDRIHAQYVYGGFNYVGNDRYFVGINPAMNFNAYAVQQGAEVHFYLDGVELVRTSDAYAKSLFDGLSSCGGQPFDMSGQTTYVAYDSSHSYIVGELCSYTPSGASKVMWYRCTTACTGVVPTNTSYWEDVSASGTYTGVNPSKFTSFKIVVTKFPKSFGWENGIVLFWRVKSQRPNYVSVRKIDTNGNYYDVVSDFALVGPADCIYLGLGTSSGTQNGLELTFTGFTSTTYWNFALSQIAFTGNQGSLEGAVLFRAGGTVFGNISPYSNALASLGTSSLRWNYVYGTTANFSGDATISGTITSGNVNPSSNNAKYLGSASYRWAGVYGVNANFSGTLAVTGATTLSSTLSVTGKSTLTGGAEIPSTATLKIGDATISWVANSGNGYLKIDKPLVTEGDQIVNSGTPGGGGSGGAGYLYELGDVLTDANHTAVKQYDGTTSAGNTNLFAYNGTKWYALKLGSNLGITNGVLNATNTTYSFSNADATLAWATRTKIATTGGTDIYVTMPSNPNTDANVAQTATTTSAAYEILFSGTADNTTRTEGARKTSTLTYNPSTKALSTGGAVNGLTLTAATTGFTIAGGTTSKTLTVNETGTAVLLTATQALTNKTYNGYTLGDACAKAVVTSIDTSASLPTSNAVKTFVEGKGYVTTDENVKVNNTNPTSGTWYYPVWYTSTSGTGNLNANNGLQYFSLEGTASADGRALLSLGNSTATGTAGNKYGELRLYSKQTFFASFVTATLSSSNKTYTFPNASGNVVLDSASQTLTNKTYNGLTLTAATTGFTIAGGTTSKTLTVSESYTLGAACAKGYTDSSSASAISTGTSLVTERDVYYGLPTINNSHSYTSSTTIYAPSGAGTSGYWLKSSGGTSAPTWAAWPTTLSGYGITDAKIASGVITLGSNTITPVTAVAVGTGDNAENIAVTAGDSTSNFTVPFATSTKRFKKYAGTNEAGGFDLNTLLTGGGITYNYGGASYWANGPTGMTYGGVLQLNSNNSYDTLAAQIAWDVDHTNAETGKMWWRDKNSQNSGTWGSWHLIYDSGNAGTGYPWGCTTLTATGKITSTVSSGWSGEFTTAKSAVALAFSGGHGVFINSTESTNSTHLLKAIYGQTTLGTGGTTALIVRCDGNVGIGTDSPAAKLEVLGEATITRANGTSLILQGNSANTNSGEIIFRGRKTSTTGFKIAGEYPSGTPLYDRQNLTIYASDATDAITWVQALQITRGANVIIGTSDANKTLTVNGATTITGTLDLGTSSAAALNFQRTSVNYITAPESGYFAFVPNGSATQIANAPLVVNDSLVCPGKSTTTLGSTTYPWIYGYFANSIYFTRGGTYNAIVNSTKNSGFDIYTTANADDATAAVAFRLDPNKNGRCYGSLTRDGYDIHSRTDARIYVWSANTSNASIALRAYSGNYLQLGSGTYTTIPTMIYGQYIRFFTYNTSSTSVEAIRIIRSGYVGIGTTSPTQKLHVDGTILSTGDQVVNSDATLKKDWKPLNYGISDIAKATAGVFTWKDGKGISAGTKAQDWEKLVPQLVHGEEGHKSLAYGQIAMLNSILLARGYESHEERIKRLEAENLELKKEIEQLKTN